MIATIVVADDEDAIAVWSIQPVVLDNRRQASEKEETDRESGRYDAHNHEGDYLERRTMCSPLWSMYTTDKSGGLIRGDRPKYSYYEFCLIWSVIGLLMINEFACSFMKVKQIHIICNITLS